MAQQAEIIWTDGAKEELRDVYAHLLDAAPRFADAFVDEVEKRVASLAKFPDSGRMMPGKNVSFLREILIQKYRIIYVHLEQMIFIVAVRNQAEQTDWL